MGGVNLATAYVRIIPTVEGIQGNLGRMFGEAGDQAGGDFNRGFGQRDPGGAAGDSFLGGLKGKALLGVAGIAAAAGAAFVDAYNEAVDQRQSEAKLRANLGLEPDAARQLGKVAGQLYADGYGESIGELTSQVGEVFSSIKGLDIQDSGALQSLTGKALSFADAFDTDVATAVQSVGTLMNSGLVPDATSAFDLITKASQKVPAALRGDVLDASDEYSQFFRTLGFSGDQAFDALVKGAEKGTFGIDKTGDAIKEFTIRSTDMSASSVAAYQAIGLSAGDMSKAILAGGTDANTAFQQIVDGILNIQDPTTQANTAIALFGTQMEDLNVADVPQFLSGLKGMSGSLGDVAGAADDMDAAMGSTTSGVELFWRNLKTNIVDFIRDEVMPRVTQFTAWLGEELGPYLQMAAQWISTTLVPAVRDLVTWLGEHLGPVVQKVGIFFRDDLIPFLSVAYEWFSVNLLPVLQRFGEFVGSTFDNIATVVGGIIDFLGGIFTGDWERVWEGIKSIFSGIWDQILNIASLAWDVLTSVGGKILDWLSGLPGWAWERIQAFGSFLVDKGAQILQWIWDGIVAKAEEVWTWFTNLPGRIWEKVAAGGSWVVERGMELIGWIASGIESGATAVWDWFAKLPGRIWDGLLAIKDKVLSIGSDFVNWIVEGVTSVAGKIWDAIVAALTGDGAASGRPEDSLTGANLPGVTPGGIARGGLVARAGGGMMDFLSAENTHGRNWVRPQGYISGPGGPVEDAIPTWLSDGEYVNRAASVAKYFPALDALNSDKPEKAMWSLLPHLAAGGFVGAQGDIKQFGSDLAWSYANALIDQAKKGAASTGVSGFNSSQNPASFGWQRASGIVPFSWKGNPFVGGVAKGTEPLWTGLMNALVPQIPGGLMAPIWAYENRQNVNSPGNASFHAYGLAADINAPQNPNGASGDGRSGPGVIPAAAARSLAARFGMEWGGDFRDPMHFEIHVSPDAVGGAGGSTSGGWFGNVISTVMGKLGLGSSSPAGVDGGPFPPMVERWRPLVADVLRQVGTYKGLNLLPFVDRGLMQINSESSGDPDAINLSDRNATVLGQPSIGLLQVIRDTFINALSGTPFANLIAAGQRDPRASVTASTLYSLGRYGTLDRAWQGHAYDQGGWLMPQNTGINLLRKPEAVLTPPQSAALIAHARNLELGFAGATSGFTFTGDINLGSGGPAEFFDEALWMARVAG